jgi:hypothetical protein
VILGEPDQPLAEAAPAQVGPHIEPVQLPGPVRRIVDRDAAADLPALVLGDPECAALLAEGAPRGAQIRKILMEIE